MTLNWKVAADRSRPANAYLSQLVQLARTDGGTKPAAGELGEPGGGWHGDGHLRAQQHGGGPQALASGNLDAAEKLAGAAVQQEPTDRAAKHLLSQ